MSNVSAWSQTAASNNSSPPNGWPEGMAPSAVNDAARELMAALAKWYAGLDASLVTTGSSNAYVLSTGSSHAALADIGLLAFRANHSNTGAATLAVDGLTAKAIRSRGAAIASGAIVQDDIYLVSYNGTDDAFDMHTVPAAFNQLVAGGLSYPTADGTTGQYLSTNGAGALSFANASANVTRSARTSNTILAAGDKAVLVEATSGTFTQTITAPATLGDGWYCFYRNSGTGVITFSDTISGTANRVLYTGESMMVMSDGAALYAASLPTEGNRTLASVTVSAVATVDVALPSGYTEYELRVQSLVPVTDGVTLNLLTSTDGGSTYDAGVSDYEWDYSADYGAGVSDNADSKIPLVPGNIGSTGVTESGASLVIRIVRPGDAVPCSIVWDGSYIESAAGRMKRIIGNGRRLASADVTNVRLVFSSGNAESGFYQLRAIRSW